MTAVELCVQDPDGARIAAQVGAARVELCSALGLGGVTPSAGLLRRTVAVAAVTGVGVHALIRPRAGDFRYDRDEVEVMRADVAFALEAGADGVVVGALDDAGLPDLAILAELVAAADGAEVTFHRALDRSADPVSAYRMVAEAGVTRVLTSGGRPNAALGADRLAAMIALGLPTQVMAGGGVALGNVRDLAGLGVAAVHFSAKRDVRGEGLALGSADGGGHERTDAALAAAMVAALRG